MIIYRGRARFWDHDWNVEVHDENLVAVMPDADLDGLYEDEEGDSTEGPDDPDAIHEEDG